MNDQVAEIIETAMLKEVASAALYHKAAGQTDDPAAAALLRELAEAEEKHLTVLKNLSPEALIYSMESTAKISELKQSDHLKAPDELAGADLTGTLLFAIKQEASSVIFYKDLSGVFSDDTARKLALTLAEQELGHQQKLEQIYDRVIYIEN